MPMQMSSERVGYLVRLVSRYAFPLRPPKQLENARPTMLRSQIRHARHDVEVHVREAFGFGKLNDVRLGAPSHAPKRAGQRDLPHS